MLEFSAWLNKQTPESIAHIKNSRVGYYFTKSITQIVTQDIFTLIDSPAFLLSIAPIRHKLGIKNAPFSNYYDLVTKAKVQRTPPFTIHITPKEFAQTLTIPYYWHKILSLWHPLDHPKIKELEIESMELLITTRKPPYLIEVVMQSILLNQIGWGSTIHMYPSSDTYLPLPEVMPAHIITVNPRTTYKEVKQVMKTIGENYFRHNKYKELPKYMPHFMDYHSWYWQRINGKTYSQIAKDWNNEPGRENIGENDISRAVNKYTNLLSF